MNIRRTLATGSVALFAAVALTACFGSPAPASLTGNWGATDSDGDVWAIEFQGDKTLKVSFNEDGPFDDSADTWSLSGTTLDFTVTGFEEGTVTCNGEVGDGSIPLECDLSGYAFTMTLER